MLAGAIISEVSSLIFVNRIIVSYSKEPEEILEDKLLRYLSLFSLLYIISLFMLFFSGVERFSLYSLIIGVASLSELAFRKTEKGRALRITVGSALSLLLLLDAFRHILQGVFL